MLALENDFLVLKRFQRRLTKEYGDHPAFHDDGLTTKLRGIHEMIELLRRKLAAEKRHLMKERFETQSLCSIHSTSNRNSLVWTSAKRYPHEYHNYNVPTAYGYYPVVDWTSYLITPNYDYEYYSGPCCNALPYGSCVAPEAQRREYRDPAALELYRGHLEDVERMCDEELANMESSMVNLRKIRKDWNCYELNATPERRRKRTKHRTRHRTTYYYTNDYS